MQAGSGNIMPLHPSSLTACEDMVSLGDMNNAALLHNLRLRYWEDDIFVSLRRPSFLARHLVVAPSACAHASRLALSRVELTRAGADRRTSARF